MREIRYNKVKLNTSEDLFIHPLGDLHIGHQNCNLSSLKRKLESIPNTPNHRIVLMGDLIDCGTRNSIGASPYEQKLSPNKQLNTIKEIFNPYSEQIDGVVMGNHEYRISKESGIDVMEQFCDAICVPYLLYSGVVTYSLGSQGSERAYNIYMTHGSAGGGIANALRKCKDFSNKVIADVYLMGHSHQNASIQRAMKYVDSRNEKITENIQNFVLTGHCLDYDDSYADMANLEISPKGFPVVECKGSGKKKVTVI